MRLGNEVVGIALSGADDLLLVPSLAMAVRCFNELGPLHHVAQQVKERRLSTIAAIIRPHAIGIPEGELLEAVWRRLSEPEGDFLNRMLDYLGSLSGMDPDASAADADADGDHEPDYAAFYRRLFAVGTGWLGWAPEQTWNSTPLEIVTAFQALQEKLRAIHGGGDDKPKDAEDLDRKTAVVMAGLAKKTVRRARK